MTVVLAGSKNLLQVSKAVFVAGVFDLAFIGLDAYIWRETRKEADLIAKINAARAALDHSLDASYFDIEQFYLQNFEEDKKKIRAELKQSVIQVINGISTGSVAVNDPVTVGL